MVTVVCIYNCTFLMDEAQRSDQPPVRFRTSTPVRRLKDLPPVADPPTRFSRCATSRGEISRTRHDSMNDTFQSPDEPDHPENEGNGGARRGVDGSAGGI
jgi:hypothetical protein